MSKATDLSQIPNASLGFKNRIINGAELQDADGVVIDGIAYLEELG
jgi:hypothetical protein